MNNFAITEKYRFMKDYLKARTTALQRSFAKERDMDTKILCNILAEIMNLKTTYNANTVMSKVKTYK